MSAPHASPLRRPQAPLLRQPEHDRARQDEVRDEPSGERTRAVRPRHRGEVRAKCDRLGWSFAIHRTDRPATDLLLRLHAQMGAGPAGTGVNRWHAVARPGRLA